MHEPERSAKANAKTRAGVLTVLVIIAIGAGVWWMIWQGRNSAEAEAIGQLRALNQQAISAGTPQPVVMQMDAEQKHVATIIVQGHLEQTLPLLAKLHHVTEVYLADTDFDNDDADVLNDLPRLNSLILSNTKITDAGVRQLPGGQLHQLHLAGTSISPQAVDVVGQMKALQVLDLSRTRVQENLAPLANLEELKWLLLNGCDLSQITDRSVEALTKIPNLSRLTVRDTRISRDVVDRLKVARPGLNVEVDNREESPDELTQQS